MNNSIIPICCCVYGDNGVGKSYTVANTCRKPALILWTDPIRPEQALREAIVDQKVKVKSISQYGELNVLLNDLTSEYSKQIPENRFQTVVLDSLTFADIDYMNDVIETEGGRGHHKELPQSASPGNYGTLSRMLERTARSLSVLSRYTDVIVICNERTEVVRYDKEGNPVETYTFPLLQGQAFPRIMGGFFNLVGRMSREITEDLNGGVTIVRELKFAGSNIKSKYQGRYLEAHPTIRGVNFAELFDSIQKGGK